MILLFAVCKVTFHSQINFKKEQTPDRYNNVALHGDQSNLKLNSSFEPLQKLRSRMGTR